VGCWFALSGRLRPIGGVRPVRLGCRVVVQRRGFARSVLLDEPRPLGRRVGERRAGHNHPRQRASPRLIEEVAQPGLRRALGEPADRRAATFRPRRSDLLLDLPAVGQPALRAPDRRLARSTPNTCPVEGRPARRTGRPSRDILGGAKQFREIAPSPQNPNRPGTKDSAAGRIRTCDPRIRRCQYAGQAP